jgi:ornithine carbamoyltransferase
MKEGKRLGTVRRPILIGIRIKCWGLVAESEVPSITFHARFLRVIPVMSWAYAPSPWKPLSVPHSVASVGTNFGMDVVLTHPKGFELDPKVIQDCKRLADENGGSFEVSYDMKEGFEGADVVYPKSWTSIEYLPPKRTTPDLDGVRQLIDKHKDWICDQKMMDLCNKRALYMHCLPADRGFEVTDEVMDGPNSVIFDQAENRLHAQKAVMALTMGERA